MVKCNIEFAYVFEDSFNEKNKSKTKQMWTLSSNLISEYNGLANFSVVISSIKFFLVQLLE